MGSEMCIRDRHEEIWPIIEGQIFRLGRYEGLQVRRSKVNPIIIIKVMMEKDLPLSPELKAALDRCLERENRNRLMAEKPLVKQTGGKQESEVAINAEPNAPIDEGQNIDGEILYPRAKTTLLNLIYILSEMEPLRYDPKGGNSTVHRTVLNVFERQGMRSNTTTIKKWLDEAHENAKAEKEKHNPKV